ncbi:hypothetical protein R1sor_009496 [Riccia sorocarpa]|uniref:NAD-dependent epimerase/dehydratase domain-containing protein n=1 Tax=Riccia sorocarpa TaxID=122646 RepID=A0ABD3HZ94_9MARC
MTSNVTVVVTGANGFIAAWIVKQLLERGYNVRGTVRNPNDDKKLSHLLDLPGAKERLVLYKAELLVEGDFDEAIAGADYVIHTATGADFYNRTDPYGALIDPAVKGTLNVLRSAAKAKTVKRVVQTSSVVAVFYSDRFISRTDSDVVDETWWGDPDYCLKNELYYHAGKNLAERAANEFAKDAPFDLVSILPATVIGRMLQKSVNWSSGQVLSLLKGIDRPEDRTALIPDVISFVDVEDVALAHILAMENPAAEGRYLAVESSMTNDQMALLLAKLYPEYTSVLKPPLNGLDEETFLNKRFFQFSNEKLKLLGLKFTPTEESVKRAVESLQQLNETRTTVISVKVLVGGFSSLSHVIIQPQVQKRVVRLLNLLVSRDTLHLRREF